MKSLCYISFLYFYCFTIDGIVEIRIENGGKVVEVRAGQKTVITREGEGVNLCKLNRWW